MLDQLILDRSLAPQRGHFDKESWWRELDVIKLLRVLILALVLVLAIRLSFSVFVVEAFYLLHRWLRLTNLVTMAMAILRATVATFLRPRLCLLELSLVRLLHLNLPLFPVMQVNDIQLRE